MHLGGVRFGPVATTLLVVVSVLSLHRHIEDSKRGKRRR